MFEADGTTPKQPFVKQEIHAGNSKTLINIAQVRKDFEAGKTVEIPDINRQFLGEKAEKAKSAQFSRLDVSTSVSNTPSDVSRDDELIDESELL